MEPSFFSRTVPLAFDRGVNGEQRNVRMILISRVLATFAAYVERPETDQLPFGVAVNPDSAPAERDSLRDVVEQHPCHKGVVIRPA